MNRETYNYRVTIPYREPEFQRQKGHDGRYQVTFEVEAFSDDHARKLALESFRFQHDNELVHWRHEVDEDGIRIEKLD